MFVVKNFSCPPRSTECTKYVPNSAALYNWNSLKCNAMGHSQQPGNNQPQEGFFPSSGLIVCYLVVGFYPWHYKIFSTHVVSKWTQIKLSWSLKTFTWNFTHFNTKKFQIIVSCLVWNCIHGNLPVTTQRLLYSRLMVIGGLLSNPVGGDWTAHVPAQCFTILTY